MKIVATIKKLDTKTLLRLHNKLTDKNTKRFASRAKGEAQTIGAAKVAGMEVTRDILIGFGFDIKINPLTPKPRGKLAPSRANHEPTIKNPRGTNLLAPDNGCPVPCREGSKQAILLDSLANPKGATMPELLKALSGGNKPWTEATVRSGFGWDMKQKGYGVRSSFNGTTEHFFIVCPLDKDGNAFPVPAHRLLKKKLADLN